jgi:hypothetical protein
MEATGVIKMLSRKLGRDTYAEKYGNSSKDSFRWWERLKI